MEIAYQIMMGLSLAACAGFRTWLPLFVLGLMARTGHVPLHASMTFLSSDGMLIIFGVASVLEFLGDKIIAVDHFLDAVGTVARPVAGTILASSLFVKMDLSTALLLGLIAGGGTALTMHAGKATVRAKSTLLAPVHGGFGNMALSIGEDILTLIGSFLAIFAPILAFLGTIALGIIAVGAIYLGYHTGRRLLDILLPSRSTSSAEPALAEAVPSPSLAVPAE